MQFQVQKILNVVHGIFAMTISSPVRAIDCYRRAGVGNVVQSTTENYLLSSGAQNLGHVWMEIRTQNLLMQSRLMI